MGSEWKETTLGEYVELTMGFPFKSSEFTNFGIRLARGDNVKRGFFEWGDKAKYWPGELKNLEQYLMKPGDILIGMDGSRVGENWVKVRDDDIPCLLVQRVARLRNKKGLDQSFLWHLISNPLFVNYIKAVHTGTTIPHISGSQIKSFPINLPPLPEQRAIAHVLGTLEDKIEWNRKTNETLEAMAQALFKSWFVDFEPVRAKAEGRETGLSLENEDLFPDRLVRNEELQEEVPVGWTIKPLAETCTKIFSGGTPNTRITYYWGGVIPWLSSGETRSRFIIDTEKTITEDGVANSSTRVARSGCTVIAGAGQGHTRGQTSLLTFESYINQSVVALEANLKVSSDFFLFFDLIRRYDEFRQLSDSHSSRGSLTTKLLATVKVVQPSRAVIEKFDETVGLVVAQITNNMHQSSTLASIRDALLPKLLSGEVRIPEVEKYVMELNGRST